MRYMIIPILFMQACSSSPVDLKEEKDYDCNLSFDTIDTNGDKFISNSEWNESIKKSIIGFKESQIRESINSSNIDELFYELDINNDKKISSVEFCKGIKKI